MAEIKVNHHERHTDIEAGPYHAEFWAGEQLLHFYLDGPDGGYSIGDLSVEDARRVAEFILAAANELERFKRERE